MLRRLMVCAAAAVVLAGCGGSDNFAKWADRALDQKVTAENIGSQVDSGNAMVGLTCALWATSSAEARSKSPAALAGYATAAGFESSPDDALAWLDAHCTS